MADKNYSFGIDLGTTYSCISYVDETGRPTVIKNFEDQNTTPSVVHFVNEGQVEVGQVAKDSAVLDPDNTIQFVKRLMGKTTNVFNFNDRVISPEEVSSYILKKIVQDASQNLGCEIKNVIITCPAYFGKIEREATEEAGKLAGLNVIGIVKEPTAAALYYGCGQQGEEKTILVYDLGGGTFDVTILEIQKDKFIEICSEGNHELGGKDWDDVLINYVRNRFVEETGYDGEFDSIAMQDLAIKCENAKKMLSKRDKTPVIVDVNGLRASIEVSRKTFDEITRSLLDQTIELTKLAINEARQSGKIVDEVILVGGSSYMPQVSAAIKSNFGFDAKLIDPNEAVAKGAALWAVSSYQEKWEKYSKIDLANLDDKEKEEAENYKQAPTVNIDLVPSLHGKVASEFLITSSTKSYATSALSSGVLKCFNIILKNVRMEDGVITNTETFYTSYPGQEIVDIGVYESDITEEVYDYDENVEANYSLGHVELSMAPNLPEGSPVEITFMLDSEGFLSLKGRDPISGNVKEAKFIANRGSNFSDHDREKIKNIVSNTDVC